MQQDLLQQFGNKLWDKQEEKLVFHSLTKKDSEETGRDAKN